MILESLLAYAHIGAILAMVVEIIAIGFVLNDWHKEIFSAVIGIFRLTRPGLDGRERIARRV